MDLNDIKKEYLEKRYHIIKNIINEKQKKFDNGIYPDKDKHDKIICTICGGKYVRSLKCIHDKTKKHCKKLVEIYNYCLE